MWVGEPIGVAKLLLTLIIRAMTDLLDAVTLFTQSESQLVTACATYQERVAEYRRKTDME